MEYEAMTMPAEDTLEREKDKLWVKDSELIRRLGVPEKLGRETLKVLVTRPDFPKKQKLWGDRRYWPAVKAYFDRHYGPIMVPSQRRETA
jgi:hypothetical protein